MSTNRRDLSPDEVAAIIDNRKRAEWRRGMHERAQKRAEWRALQTIYRVFYGATMQGGKKSRKRANVRLTHSRKVREGLTGRAHLPSSVASNKCSAYECAPCQLDFRKADENGETS